MPFVDTTALESMKQLLLSYTQRAWNQARGPFRKGLTHPLEGFPACNFGDLSRTYRQNIEQYKCVVPGGSCITPNAFLRVGGARPLYQPIYEREREENAQYITVYTPRIGLIKGKVTGNRWFGGVKAVKAWP